MTHKSKLATVSLVCLLVSAGVSANELSIRVSKRGTSDVVKAAVVCLGTPANHAQFGTVLTDSAGDVRFSQVPGSTPLVLTVSRPGFQGRRIVIDPFQADKTVFLSLPAGGGGPACEQIAAVTESVASNLLGLDDLRINGGADVTTRRNVILSFSVTGEPTHYRVSEDRSFGAARWAPFRPLVEYRLSPGAGSKTVYLQLRRVHSQSGASIEGVSNVAASRIRLGG